MSRGKRYNSEPKINMKKVIAVIVVILVIAMFVVVIKTLLQKSKEVKVTNDNYFTAYVDSKYGVIDKDGKTVIEPSYAEYIVIPNSKKDIFICTYDVNYSTGEYKTKALNSKDEEIFTEYEQIEALENYDKNQIVYYENNAIKVRKNGKYGIINIDKKEILPCEYDDIKTLKGLENSILVYKDGKVGLVDSKGNKIIDTNYTNILSVSEDYKLGYITIDTNGKYGVVDCNNTKVLDNKYEDIKQLNGNGNYVVKENGKYKLIKKDGTTILENKFDNVENIKNDKLIIKIGNKYGVINTSGETVLDTNYDEVKFSFTDTYIIKQNGTYGIINKDKKMVVESKYTSMNYIDEAGFIEASEDGIYSDMIASDYLIKITGIVSDLNIELGYLRMNINNEYKYYNFKFEEKNSTEILTNNTLFLVKKDGKYGYSNKNGNIVIECIYDDATEQNKYGYVAVKKDGKWGSFDKNGNKVAEINRVLDNNLKIDFIGEWNLTEDTNMNCYTK